MSGFTVKRLAITLALVSFLAGGSVFAQTSEFTYQGKLADNSVIASGNYDFEFRLFAAAAGGTAIGTLQRLGVPVSSGVFTVRLDFGAQFTGAARYLEIAVKPAGGTSFTTLNPRQPVTSAPYNIRSLSAQSADVSTNSAMLGGIAANQYVLAGDARLTDARPPLPGSGNYLQNSPSFQAAEFNISGNGAAAIFDAALQYSIGGVPALRTQSITRNTFVGNTGQGGNRNSFVGDSVGAVNSANDNSFFGSSAGNLNTTGSLNSFFGSGAGLSNQTGGENSFFGYAAGSSNKGCCNSFFGRSTGQLNQTGQLNSFFGAAAGFNNLSGSRNTFIGISAGDTNTTGFDNVIIGYNADVSANNLANANAVGAYAFVSQNNSLVLGSISGVNGAAADTKVGIGTTAPNFKLEIIDPSNTGLRVQNNTVGGTVASFGGTGEFRIDSNGVAGGRLFVQENGASFINYNDVIENDAYRLYVNGSIFTTGYIRVGVLSNAGATPLCRNAGGGIATCSSSIRYKKNINPFNSGLNLVNRLRPVSFNWKADDKEDLGLIAEEVAEVEPLLVTRNDKGEIEGVKYDRLGVVLINAVKEQQVEINEQNRQNESLRKLLDEQIQIIKQQQTELDALKSLVCSQNPAAKICQPKN